MLTVVCTYFPGCVSQEYCKLLAYLIRGAGNCGNIHTEVKKLMKHAVHYPVSDFKIMF